VKFRFFSRSGIELKYECNDSAGASCLALMRLLAIDQYVSYAGRAWKVEEFQTVSYVPGISYVSVTLRAVPSGALALDEDAPQLPPAKSMTPL
jgi:hypothetical protein